MTVQELLSARFPSTVAEVLGLMQALERALPRDDGVVFFLRLYRAVTEAVDDAVRPGGEYADPRFCRWLDVVFANSFFRALRDATQRRPGVPKAWEPLIEARSRPGVVPIQFALAGMNAHINFDLCVALNATCRLLDIRLARGSGHHRDYLRVNETLERVQEQVKREYLSKLGQLGDDALGRVDDVVAMWKVARARDAAWTHAEALGALRASPRLADHYLDALGGMVGLAGRGLLVPTLRGSGAGAPRASPEGG